jgi:hypothetical protein
MPRGIRPFLRVEISSCRPNTNSTERAAEARAIASAATLDNVRDRWLRSEASWTEMAARRERGEKMRAKLIAEKAAERAALKTVSQV